MRREICHGHQRALSPWSKTQRERKFVFRRGSASDPARNHARDLTTLPRPYSRLGTEIPLPHFSFPFPTPTAPRSWRLGVRKENLLLQGLRGIRRCSVLSIWITTLNSFFISLYSSFFSFFWFVCYLLSYFWFRSMSYRD